MLKLIKINILTLCLLTIGCQNRTSQLDNSLNYPLRSQVSTLDPAKAYDTVASSVIYQSHEQLYQYHYLKRPYTIEPLLAEGLPQITNNDKRYTIKIKKNIIYHPHPSFNGKDRFLKAQDFITQIKRIAFRPTNSSGWWLFDNKIKGLNQFRKEAGDSLEKFQNTKVEGLTALNDHTLVIDLNRPYPQMLYALTMSFSSPVPIELVKKTKNNLHDIMIGTGPYMLIKWQPSSKIEFIKFKKYHQSFYPKQGDRKANANNMLHDAGKKIPFIDKLIFHIIKEPNTRWLNFINKKLDFLIIPKDNYNSAIGPEGRLNSNLKNKNIKLQIFPTLTYWWIAFNMQHPILGKNLKLRKAIAHAIDINKYIKVFTNNIGQKANSIYPPGVPGYDPSKRLPYSFDLKKAHAFLKEAGFPKGKGLPIFNYDVRGMSATNRHMAEFIKSELKTVGIKIKLNLNSFPAFLEKAKMNKLHIWQGGWAMDYPDIENVLQLLHSKNWSPGPNATLYSNKIFDQLLDKLSISSNDKQKKQLSSKMEKIINRDLPWVMQYYTRNYVLTHERLKNYRHSDIIFNNIKYLKIKN